MNLFETPRKGTLRHFGVSKSFENFENLVSPLRAKGKIEILFYFYKVLNDNNKELKIPARPSLVFPEGKKGPAVRRDMNIQPPLPLYRGRRGTKVRPCICTAQAHEPLYIHMPTKGKNKGSK
jgi:hypothetical protein